MVKLVFILNGNKIITSGGGGLIVGNDIKLMNIIKHLSTQAKIDHKWEYLHDMVGYNFRMPNINAALGLAQMEQLNKIIKRKKILYNEYLNSLVSKDFIVKPIPETTKKWNYWLTSLQFNSKVKRDEYLSILNKHQIQSRPLWGLIHNNLPFKHFQRDDQKNANYLADHILNIPSNI